MLLFCLLAYNKKSAISFFFSLSSFFGIILNYKVTHDWVSSIQCSSINLFTSVFFPPSVTPVSLPPHSLPPWQRLFFIFFIFGTVVYSTVAGRVYCIPHSTWSSSEWPLPSLLWSFVVTVSSLTSPSSAHSGKLPTVREPLILSHFYFESHDVLCSLDAFKGSFLLLILGFRQFYDDVL